MSKFSHCLGKITKGFEAEILTFLMMMKERNEQKGKKNGRWKSWNFPGFEETSKKLEFIVSCLGARGGKCDNLSSSKGKFFVILEFKRC